jgi:hypothetical protein
LKQRWPPRNASLEHAWEKVPSFDISTRRSAQPLAPKGACPWSLRWRHLRAEVAPTSAVRCSTSKCNFGKTSRFFVGIRPPPVRGWLRGAEFHLTLCHDLCALCTVRSLTTKHLRQPAPRFRARVTACTQSPTRFRHAANVPPNFGNRDNAHSASFLGGRASGARSYSRRGAVASHRVARRAKRQGSALLLWDPRSQGKSTARGRETEGRRLCGECYRGSFAIAHASSDQELEAHTHVAKARPSLRGRDA